MKTSTATKPEAAKRISKTATQLKSLQLTKALQHECKCNWSREDPNRANKSNVKLTTIKQFKSEKFIFGDMQAQKKKNKKKIQSLKKIQ